MKRALGVICLLLLVSVVALAAPQVQTTNVQPFPKTLINARYVYVTSYDGDQFDPRLLPEDRQAISSVQSALQQWGHYIVVYRPKDADMILVVQSRPTEDVLAVYDARTPAGSNFLWRAMGHEGLQKGETPLVTQLRQAVEKASQ
ncbi:MAG: hypothetical protein LAN63_01150 [Acidobacteriia bacterium]|nr:hypothetical protein [Terriglobia bacterium]